MTQQKVHIIGGGTVSHVRSHLALTAPAYGATGRRLAELCTEYSNRYEINLHLTKMANSGQGKLETNQDIANLVNQLVKDESTKMIFFNPAITDFEGRIIVPNEEGDITTPSGKYEDRLQTRVSPRVRMELTAQPKIIGEIRKVRKDIYLIGFKTTTGASEDEQYIAGLHLLKSASANLVLANDLRTRTNMVITPEEARYHTTTNREEALQNLVEIAYLRSNLHYTRSTVVDGEPISWSSELIPATVRQIVDYCIDHGAYKPFRGKTAGHFAIKVNGTTFLTSRRKTDFNTMENVGLVKVETQGDDNIIAYGSKPSVGGQSQRIIFGQHPEYDSIVHFHCPIKEGSQVPVRSQRPYECGSHECGQNTSSGLQKFGNVSAVYLDQHGPNIVFNSAKVKPQEVINFIEHNFELSKKTGGLVSPGEAYAH